MTYTNREFGALGEKHAAAYLKKQGYKILDKNYKSQLGEIDLIARDGEEVVFIEVKTRSQAPYLSGAYSVDQRKQFHILRAAASYLKLSRIKLQPRFDVIEVEARRSDGALVAVNHIKNAFGQNESYARF